MPILANKTRIYRHPQTSRNDGLGKPGNAERRLKISDPQDFPPPCRTLRNTGCANNLAFQKLGYLPMPAAMV